MDDNAKIKVKSRASGIVVYRIPDMGNLRREFQSREEKILTFEELRKLSYTPGGVDLIRDYLIIRDKEALEELNLNFEPEYWYEADEVVNLLKNGTMDEFLDCLDFAPEGVLDLIKEYSVTLPLNDVAKREALLEKLNFNVDNAIRIQKESRADDEQVTSKAATRRAAVPGQDGNDKQNADAKPARRVIVKSEEK